MLMTGPLPIVCVAASEKISCKPSRSSRLSQRNVSSPALSVSAILGTIASTIGTLSGQLLSVP